MAQGGIEDQELKNLLLSPANVFINCVQLNKEDRAKLLSLCDTVEYLRARNAIQAYANEIDVADKLNKILIDLVSAIGRKFTKELRDKIVADIDEYELAWEKLRYVQKRDIRTEFFRISMARMKQQDDKN